MSGNQNSGRRKAWNNGCGDPGRGGVYVKELTPAERALADSMAMPWRDAGANKRLLPSQVSPHKCRIEIRETKIKGDKVKIETRR